MKKLLNISWMTLAAMTAIAQFTPQQSQYMYNQLAVNPGATGKDNALNATVNYRTMWHGVQGAPKTMYASFHTPLKNESIAVGLQVFQDKIGVTTKTGIYASGAYRIQLYNASLSFGLSAGMVSNQNNWSDIITVEQGDRVFNEGNMSYWLPNSSAGVYYESKKGFAGISVPQLFSEVYSGGNSYRNTFDLSNYSYHFLGGRNFKLNQQFTLLASGLLKYNKSSQMQMDLTAIGKYNDVLELGFSVRPKDAMSMITRIYLNGQFSIAYSYDYLTSRLGQYNKGTHEVGMFYTFIYQTKAPNTKFY